MPDEKVAFDVFLSHNSKDKPVVRQIAEALKERGLRVWLDEWELIPGRRWIPELEKVIETAKTAAVMVGESGFGRWEQPEYEGALSEFVERGLPVIPVFLPGAPEKPKLPLFLRGFTWVDLRGGLTKDGLDRLVWGIKGEKQDKGQGTSPVARFGPRLHNLPFSSLGDLLKGRDEELRKLQDGAATAITQAETIYGLGGIGKTRLAVEHAWRSGNLYDYAFFVVAESQEALRSNLANLARPDLLNLPEYKAAAQEESVAAVLRWLREHDRWLLILDNVDTKESEQAVVEIVPSLSAGRVLITSRIRDWPATIRRQSIETLSLDEAQRFILDRTANDRAPSDDDPDQALRLAEELGGLPLALEQAAAYIAKRQMSLAEYLEEWEKERERVLNWYDKSIMQYPASVAMTWQKTFQQLSPTAAAILRLIAFLAPDPIPIKMLKNCAGLILESSLLQSSAMYRTFCQTKFFRTRSNILFSRLGNNAQSKSPFNIVQRILNKAVNNPELILEAISDLTSYSMVTRDENSIAIHRIVQDALRSSIPKMWRRAWIERSLVIVYCFAPSKPSDVRTWPIWNSVYSHAANIVRRADEAMVGEPIAILMSDLSLFIHKKGLYLEAEPLMRRALQIDEHSLGPLHPRIAIRINNLASLLKATNRMPEAEPLMRRALQIDEDSLGPQHPNVARDLNNLAQLLQATNRMSEAEPLMRRALQIDEDSLGPQNPDVARDLHNLAHLLQATNRISEAEPLVRRALQIDEEFFGPQHPTVAVNLQNLALLLQATNRISEAEPLMRRALEIDENSFGPQHPGVARDLHNLAQLLRATNRISEAEPLVQRALQIHEEFFGPQHPTVAVNLQNLALLLQATNRISEAEPLMRRALEIDENSFGPQHPGVARDLHNLALLLQATNRISEAEPLVRRALQINEEFFGPQHPTVAVNLQNLALLLQATNRISEAEPLMRRALEIDENSFGPQHPDVARDLHNLAQLLQATNRISEAEPLVRRALQINEDSFGPQHPKSAIRLNNLASLLLATNRLSEAEPLMRLALQIDEDSFGPQHPNVARSLNNLARLLQDTNRLSEAEPLMQRALEIVETSLGTEHPNTQLVRRNLDFLLEEIAAQSRKEGPKGPKGPKRPKGR